MGFDPKVAIDDGHEVRAHRLLERSLDGETSFWRPVRLRRLEVDGAPIEALEEHGSGDGLRGHTLVFDAADVGHVDDATLERTAAEAFGIDLGAARSGPRAGAVSVKRSASRFVFATGAFHDEFRDD